MHYHGEYIHATPEEFQVTVTDISDVFLIPAS